MQVLNQGYKVLDACSNAELKLKWCRTTKNFPILDSCLYIPENQIIGCSDYNIVANKNANPYVNEQKKKCKIYSFGT